MSLNIFHKDIDLCCYYHFIMPFVIYFSYFTIFVMSPFFLWGWSFFICKVFWGDGRGFTLHYCLFWHFSNFVLVRQKVFFQYIFESWDFSHAILLSFQYQFLAWYLYLGMDPSVKTLKSAVLKLTVINYELFVLLPFFCT